MADIPEQPVTRLETYIASIAGEESGIPAYPVTRIEMYLAHMLGQAVELPQAVTRIEQYVRYIAEHGGGGGGDQPNIATWETGVRVLHGFDEIFTSSQASMRITKDSDYSISVVWVSGNGVGATIYWPIMFSVDDIDSINVKVRASNHYDENRFVTLGIASSAAPANIAQSFVQSVRTNDISGEEVVLTLDLTERTGKYYIIIRPDGVTCKLYDFKIHYNYNRQG